MATGYTLPNGQRDNWGSGFDFSNIISWSGYSQGAMYPTYCKAAACSVNGTYFINPTGGSSVPSDPKKEYGVKSGTVYVKHSPVGWDPAGSIGQYTWFKITTASTTTGSSSSGGTVTGGGNYVSGGTCTIRATPGSGFVVKSFTGYSGSLPSARGVTVSFTVSSDQTYNVGFQKVYRVIYDANGGDSDTVPSDASLHYYNSGTAYDNVTISTVVPTRSGYTFLGWSKTAGGGVQYYGGRTYSNLTSGDSITLYAVWTQYRLTYNTNGGTPTPSPFAGAAGDSLRLPQSSDVTKEGYVLSAWSISGIEYAPNSIYTLTNENLTADAIWRRPSVYITNSDTSKGTIRLYRNSVATANLVAEENKGVLMADVANGNYVVSCTNKNILFEGSGISTNIGVIDYASVKDGNGNSTVSFSLNVSFEGTMMYAKRATYSVSIVAHIMDKYGQEIIPSPQSCTASVTSPIADEIVDGVSKYIVGRSITITGSPASGYSMSQARVNGDDYSDLQGNMFTIPSINSDIIAHCYFTKIVYLARGGIDTASAMSIRKVTVDGGNAQEATYGDDVEYAAILTSGTDAVFAGWYSDGVLVSTANPYTHVVSGDITLTARAKVKASMDIRYGDSDHLRSCSINVNGSYVSPGSEFYVTLGDSFSYEIVMGSLSEGGTGSWNFDSWYYSSDDLRENPLPYGVSGSLSPTGNLSIYAYVTSEVIVKRLIISVKNDESQTPIISAGMFSVYPDADSSEYDETTGNYIFTFNGSRSVRLTSAETVTIGSEVLAFSGFSDGGVMHQDPEYTFFITAQNKNVTAYYGSSGVRRVCLNYGSANGVTGNRSMGTFMIYATDDDDAVVATDGSYADVHRGKHIFIYANPKNGYKFGGWYTAREIGGSPYLIGTDIKTTVITDRNIYAWFIQDPNAVYEWEGSAENKSLEWRSKTYKMTRPINPSCCRVDTEGYPVIELDVDMFSAPDNSPTARAELMNVSSQTARRLPVMRPERYLQVCVKNDKEVDALYVGTSMSEIIR